MRHFAGEIYVRIHPDQHGASRASEDRHGLNLMIGTVRSWCHLHYRMRDGEWGNTSIRSTQSGTRVRKRDTNTGPDLDAS